MLARAVLLLVITSMSPLLANTTTTTADVPPIEPGVSLELARWRAVRYSDVRYKLNLTLEKMSPVLKGTMEIRVNVGARTPSSASPGQAGELPPVILDWRKIKGHEEKSTIRNVSINGTNAVPNVAVADEGVRVPYEEDSEHLVFRDGVVAGENVIKMDFTSPILTSGSAITRYVDKEDGSEYIYSLFVPSDASTAFPVFDQPDIKARFTLSVAHPVGWTIISNSQSSQFPVYDQLGGRSASAVLDGPTSFFAETKPISTYVFAFAAGSFERVTEQSVPPAVAGGSTRSGVASRDTMASSARKETDTPHQPSATAGGTDKTVPTSVYVRKSQAEKFKPHATEVFRLNREAIKYFAEYFDYQFPFPKYDLVLIPEFPFGGMEHAGATFLRESSIIFPQEPTKNDHISRALLIFHEASHQWFGDTVTMRWFDDLWLKEGFATFTAYKAMERIMPSAMAWKVFYERVKQAAYRTDSTKGTTPIYQEINNLSAAKSAYGAIVYSKAPAFLRQAEFYLGEDKFRTAVRAFLKKHEFGNAGWGDLVDELQSTSDDDIRNFARFWINQRGIDVILGLSRCRTRKNLDQSISCAHTWTYSIGAGMDPNDSVMSRSEEAPIQSHEWSRMKFNTLLRSSNGSSRVETIKIGDLLDRSKEKTFPFSAGEISGAETTLIFPNHGDYGYGIFLLDDKSRDYVLKNIQNEKDPFLRSMMWGALWDSVREAELDPREYVELVVRVLSNTPRIQEGSQEDESTTALLLSRVGTAMNYYIDPEGTLPNGRVSARESLAARVENLLIDRMQDAETEGQRITYYRAFLNIASSDNARSALRAILKEKMQPSSKIGPNSGFKPGLYAGEDLDRILRFEEMIRKLPIKTKDKFDIVTRLLVLADPEAPGLLAELEKTEKGDEALRYAYAARAGIGTAENKAKYWRDFTENKEISESWIEAAFGPFNSIRHADLTLPYLERALKELPNHKRDRKIFFLNGWLGAFIGGQRSEEALAIVNKFLADNPGLDKDLRLKILENVDTIERAVRIRAKY